MKQYAKAIVGALVAAVSAAVPIVDDGVLPSEALTIGLAFLVGLGAVWAVPNKPEAHDDNARA